VREGGESGKREDGKVIPPRIKLGASPHEIPPMGACRNSFLFFVSDRIYLDSLKISE